MKDPNRKLLNIVALVIPSRSKEGDLRETYTVQRRVKDDGTDYLVSTFNCATLEKIRDGATNARHYFWSRIFYNPVAEEITPNAKLMKQSVEDIRSSRIKAGTLLYITGVAEKGGIIIKNPLQVLNQDIRTARDGQQASFAGRIISFDNDGSLSALCPVFDSKGREISNEVVFMRIVDPSSLSFLRSLPKDNDGNLEALGRSLFVFQAVKNGRVMDVSHIQGTNSPYFFAKCLSQSAEEDVGVQAQVSKPAEQSQKANIGQSIKH